MTASAAREGPDCLSRACGHPTSEHFSTPELARPAETVVWCAACRRHEVRVQRGWLARLGRSETVHRRRIGRSA
jgi:hypothetical protein